MSKSSRRKFVTGPELLAAILKTPLPIKWLWEHDKPQVINPNMAVAICRDTPHVGRLNPSGRVLYIKCLPRVMPPRDDSFWDDRAVLRYQEDRRNLPAKIKNKERADLWNRILAMNPPPASWKS